MRARRKRFQVIVSACYGSRGDVMPCLTIAAALARRLEGQATVVAMANPVFENAVAANVRFIGVGSRDEYECVQRDHASRRDARVVVRYWLDHLETHAERILEARADAGRTIVLAHTLDLAVRCVDERANDECLTCYSLVLSPALLRTPNQTIPPFAGERLRCFGRSRWAMRAADCLVDIAFAPQLNAFRASLGSTKPVKRVFDEWFLCKAGVFAMYPEYFERAADAGSRKVFQIDFPQEGGAVNVTGLNAIRVAREFIDRDDAPTVVFVSASGNPPFASQFFATAVKAMRRLAGAKAILLTRHRDRIGELPENAIHIDFLPLHLCRDAGLKIAALVHHGTIGCSATALRSAWPQVVVPAAFDQPYNAALLEAMGAAQIIHMTRLTRTRLVKALKIVFKEEARAPETAPRRRANDASSPQARVAEIIAKELLQYG